MTTDEQIDWKLFKGDKYPHVYWSEFKVKGDLGLVTKFKAGGDGFKPEALGPFEFEGAQYQAVQKTGKKTGKQYWDIEKIPPLGEKSPEEVAHESTNADYAKRDAEKQKHIDELAERKLAILERIALSLEKIARCVDDKSGVLHIRNAKDLEGE